MGDKVRTSNMHFGMGLISQAALSSNMAGSLFLSNSKKDWRRTGYYQNSILKVVGGTEWYRSLFFQIFMKSTNFPYSIWVKNKTQSAGRRQKKKSRRRADNLTRPFETAALISEPPFLCVYTNPMTTCRDTVADWRLFCRVSFAFSKLT